MAALPTYAFSGDDTPDLSLIPAWLPRLSRHGEGVFGPAISAVVAEYVGDPRQHSCEQGLANVYDYCYASTLFFPCSPFRILLGIASKHFAFRE